VKTSVRRIDWRQDAKHAKFGGKMNFLGKIVHRYSPTFAALASLREMFRVSVAALPALVIRRIKYP
jgi:hypothetical protein